jgi:ABC-type antimicrobial peptide transport system permease subunit
MGMSLLEGRDFEDQDRIEHSDDPKEPTIAIVNHSFVQRFFGTGNAIGRHLGIGEHKNELGIRIVGVVEDALLAGPRRGMQPQVFFSFLQTDYPVSAAFYVRTTLESGTIFPALRRIVSQIDPTMPVYEMKTLERQLDDTLSAERLIASLSLVFASLATVMAALGLYGVMAFSVARRTKEIGLRAALGAPPAAALWLVMREVLALLAIGLAVGLPCALLSTHYVSAQLFGVAATDLPTVAAAGCLLALVALAAAFLPARRAGTIDPLVALRQD